MAIVHSIGEPENESEKKAISRLKKQLPDNYIIFHNFEIPSNKGFPYEYDMAIVSDFTVWHVEVKGYKGEISGDKHQWKFENDYVRPSPIPLANKKSKVLAGKLTHANRNLVNVYVDTIILLTDDYVNLHISGDQPIRIIKLKDAEKCFSDSRYLQKHQGETSKKDAVCKVLFGGVLPGKKLDNIGLYEITEKFAQNERRAVYLAKHKYIRTRPDTIIKVFNFNIYTSEDEKLCQIQNIFRDQDAMRMIGAHPNLIETFDIFSWEDDKFVRPTEYINGGRPLELLLADKKKFKAVLKRNIDIILKIAKGLNHAHNAGVVHRDVQPINIVAAPNGVVKLVNFDLALFIGFPDLNHIKDINKRLNELYTAPEVWDEPLEAVKSSDIYSLGIVFYRLLVGLTPYNDINEFLYSGMDSAADEDFLINKLCQNKNEGLVETYKTIVNIIVKMTKRTPEERYQCMSEVITELSALQE